MQKLFQIKKYLFFSIILGFSSCSMLNKSVRNPANIQKSFSPFLWKAEKNGKIAYFFGTSHIPGLSLSNFPEEISSYIWNSKTFLVEADTSKLSATPVSQNQTLDKALSKQSWDKLKDFYRWQLSHSEMNEEQIEKFLPRLLEQVKSKTPWSVFLSVEIFAFASSIKTYLGINPQSLLGQKILDENLLEYAKSTSGLQISFLEEANTQWLILEKAHSVADFDNLLKKYDTVKDLFQEREDRNYHLMLCYEKADLSCMREELLAGRSSLFEKWEDALIERNKNWIPVIEKSLESGTSFIAAGVSHFIGEDSVLELLEDRGFSIDRIQF